MKFFLYVILQATSKRNQVLAACRSAAAVLAIIFSALIPPSPVWADTANGPESVNIVEARNKELVLGFYREIFDNHKVAEAFRKYAAQDYIQHSPLAGDVQSTISFLQVYLDGTPGHDWELKRILADGDLVMMHVHSWSSPEDPGRAIVDIFRVENGLVAEHWEVIQPVIKMDGRTMF